MFRNGLNHKIWILLHCLLIFSLIAACGTTSQKSIADSTSIKPDENILRVGISPSAPPLIYKQGEKVVGLEAELAQEFAQYLRKSVRFIEVEWEDQIPALLENRIDIIMSGMSVTTMRQVRISFSEPYLVTGQMALIHKRNLGRFPVNYRGIKVVSIKVRIGVVKGTTGETFVLDNFGTADKIISFDTSKKAVDALLYENIDILIDDAPMILLAASENDSKGLATSTSPLNEEYLAWGIRKNDIELLNSANRFLDTYKREGRLKSIISRWIPFVE
jgi:polar amino acid transport system substrate-binding protein